MKKKIIFTTIALILIGVVFILKDSLFDKHHHVGQHGLPAVSISELQSQDIRIAKELPGRTVAFQVAEIRPQVTGIITKRFFTEGSYVHEGDQLYQIDPSSYEASYISRLAKLNEAVANKKTAKAKKDRFDKISKKNAVISKTQHEEANLKYEQALAQARVAAAEVEKARILLGYTRVNAPISGYVGKSSVTKGALVTTHQNKVLATITELDPIYVDANLSSNEFAKLKENMQNIKDVPVKLIYNNDSNYSATGKLLFHEVNVNQSTSSVQLRAVFPNNDSTLFPGMFVHLIIEENYKDIYLVPQRVTWRDENGDLFAWILDQNNIANPVKLDVKRSYGKSWLVKNLSGNVRVITENFMRLKPGTKVSVQTEKE